MSDKIPQPDLNTLPIRIKRGKKFAKYPSIFGKLKLAELCQVARDHGMVVICGCKPDMHCRAEIGLYGTPEAMALTEDIWEAAGNDKKKPGERGTFKVDLDRKQEDWVDVQEATALRTAVPVLKKTAWKFQLGHGAGEVDAPGGWRKLKKGEVPAAGDISYNCKMQVWHPVKPKDLEYYSPEGYLKNAYGVIRACT